MAKLLWFVVGVLTGAAAAHVASRTPAGSRLFAAINGATGEFVQTVADSYRAHAADTGSAPEAG